MGQSTDIKNSYAIGLVQGDGTGAFGGFLASNRNDFYGTMENNYYDQWTTGQSDTRSDAHWEPKQTSKMIDRATYAGWDFSTIWGINTGEYPHLTAIQSNGPEALHINSVDALSGKNVSLGTTMAALSLPGTVQVDLSDGSTLSVDVTWD